MKRWQVKALLQGTLARLPGGGEGLNSLLQRLAGGRRSQGPYIDSKVVDDWVVHARLLRDRGVDLAGSELVEVGSGWLPVLPLCFALAGARRVHTYDLRRLMEWPQLQGVIERLATHLPLIAAATGQDLALIEDRHRRLQSGGGGARLLNAAGIEYHAPADAAATGLAARSVDVVFSNSVFEHVDVAVLDSLMRESARVLRVGGIASHSVNCGDHYAYFDRSITPLNYLKYTAAAWRLWNNDLLYQNRLRPCDFIASAERGGLQVLDRFWHPRPELLERLPESAIAAEFRHYARDELCATSVDIIATPRAD